MYQISEKEDKLMTSVGEMIDGTLASLTGYFQIKPCDIEAKILGGNGKAVAYFGKTSNTFVFSYDRIKSFAQLQSLSHNIESPMYCFSNIS